MKTFIRSTEKCAYKIYTTREILNAGFCVDVEQNETNTYSEEEEKSRKLDEKLKPTIYDVDELEKTHIA